MKMLLNGAFAPTTFFVGFLEARLPTIVEHHSRWMDSIDAHKEVTKKTGPLAEALRELDPLSMPPNKEIWMTTSSSWVAYFDNSIGGTDAFPPISCLCELIGCRGLTVTCSPSTIRRAPDKPFKRTLGTYGKFSFMLMDQKPHDWQNVVRSVSAAQDESLRWEFFARGTIQPFENTERYSQRKISDRINNEILEEYYSAFGIRIFDDDFYGGDYAIMHDKSQLVIERRKLSLKEARAQIGLS